MGETRKKLRMFSRWLIAIAASVALALPAWALDVLHLYDGADGATCDSFNAAARMDWRTRGGDWKDANGKPQGAAPFSEAVAVPFSDRDPQNRVVQWDITDLVRRWQEQPTSNRGLLIQAVPGKRRNVMTFFSREHDEPALRPRLRVAYVDATQKQIAPAADSFLDCSAGNSLGRMMILKASDYQRAVLYFDLGPLTAGRGVRRAMLELSKAEDKHGASTGTVDLGVYALDPPTIDPDVPVQRGLAARYPDDRGIENDPAVVKFSGFEEPFSSWKRGWAMDERSGYDVIDRDERLRFEPLQGKALRVTIGKGKNLGLNMEYYFGKEEEPEEIYFRYYLRFADTWAPKIEGGKLPGIAGTYGMDGPATGKNGWSIRGEFLRASGPGNPMERYTAVGSYPYTADMEGRYPELWIWSMGPRGLLLKNRWYCVEQYVKMNTPGLRDGVYRAWLDGRLVFEKTDVRMRDIPKIKVQKIHVNFWHGGMTPSPYDQDAFIDNLVVARQYIGPIRAAGEVSGR